MGRGFNRGINKLQNYISFRACPDAGRVSHPFTLTKEGRDVFALSSPWQSATHCGAKWCILVYTCSMTAAEKPVRQSVSLPSRLARRVRTLAKNQHTSTNRVLVELIESGIESQEAEKIKFFALADQLSASSNPAERKRIKAELARMTFGK